MQERYGLDRRPIGLWIAVGAIILGFVGALLFVAHGLTSNSTTVRLVEWSVKAPDHVDITFQATADTTQPLTCVVRAQDKHRIDLGYATVMIPPDPSGQIITKTYPLRTLAPAYTAELLGCEAGATPRVPGPQFPPGVVPPDQPWS
jgi:hypothetical protein